MTLSKFHSEGDFMRPFSRETIFSFYKPIIGLMVFCFACLFGFGAEAAWLGPTGAPPTNNIAAPLNTGTIFGGDLTGTYNDLRINVAPCEAGQSLIWQADDTMKCGDPTLSATLLDVLNNGADASNYSKGVIIGTSTTTWLDVGGAFSSSWIHATATTGYNSMKTSLGIGVLYPKHLLHVYKTWPSTAPNAQIDIQSVAGEDAYWGIYNDRNTNDLRFWNNSPSYDGYGDTEARKNSLILTSLGQVVVGGLFGNRAGDSWQQRKFQVTAEKLTSAKAVVTAAYFLGPVVSSASGSGNAYWSAFQTQKVSGTTYGEDDWRYSENRLQFGMDSNSYGYIANRSYGGTNLQSMVFGNEQFSGKDIVAISPYGNVGIGAAEPNNKLEVNGAITIDSSDPTNKTSALYNKEGDLYWEDTNISLRTATEFKGLTTTNYNGSQTGYKGMNNICASAFSGSHICTSNEMLVITRNPSVLTGVSGYAWISTGVAGYRDDYLVNDCYGWASAASESYGSIWKFSGADATGGSVWLSTCSTARPIACCE